jgi:Zn-dependent protease
VTGISPPQAPDGTGPGGSASSGSPPGQPEPPARRDPRLGLVVARVFGIPVYLSPYWFLVAALLIYLYANSLDSNVNPERTRYLVSAAFVVLLYASVLVHELAHCVVARSFGLTVRRVLMYPLGGFSEIEQEPQTPAREFLVSGAGPALSLVLALIAALLTKAVPHGLGNLLIDQLFRANLVVGLFNLLPGLPLDGGRMFRAGIWKVTGQPGRATVAAAWAGRVLAVALVLVPIAVTGGQISSLATSGYFLWLLLIAAFMWIQSGQAIRSAKVRERLPALQARRLARRAIPIPASLPLAEAVRRAEEAQARALVIVDHEGTPTAIVNEEAVMATPPQRRPWVEAGSLARTIEPGLVLPADLSGVDLIEAVRKAPASEYLLIEPSGQVYGVLATSDLDHAFAGV